MIMEEWKYNVTGMKGVVSTICYKKRHWYKNRKLCNSLNGTVEPYPITLLCVQFVTNILKHTVLLFNKILCDNMLVHLDYLIL